MTGHPRRTGRMQALTRRALGLLTVTAGLIGTGQAFAADVKMGGYTIEHTHHQRSERTISPENVGALRMKWEHVTCGTVDSTPAIVDGVIYVTDRGGCVHKLDREGRSLWREPKRIPAVLASCGIPADVIPPDLHTRNSPLVMGRHLLLGTLRTSAAISNDLLNFVSRSGAYLIAIDKDSGECLWAKKVHEHPAAVLTQSPVGFNDRVCVGVSSLEEFVSSLQNNLIDGIPFLQPDCCTFRGNIACYDRLSGSRLWHLDTIADDFYYDDPADAVPPATGLFGQVLRDPANGRALQGNAGVAVWGPTHPAIDRKRNSVYFATGNNYGLSQAIFDEARRRSLAGLPLKGDPTAVPPLPPLYEPRRNMVDAVAALDLDTGRTKWIRVLEDFDPHVGDCIVNDIFPGAGLNCPFHDQQGRDADFGQQPALIRNVRIGGRTRDLVVACQKSGVCYALDPDTGATVWQTDSPLSSDPNARPVCPGGQGGGFQQALATDGKRIYVSCANDPVSITTPWLFRGGQYQNGIRQDGTAPLAPPVCASFWVALDAATGALIWHTADPLSVCVPALSPVPVSDPAIGLTVNIPAVKNFGPATIANGVVYVGSMPSFPFPEPHYTADMYALDAETGRILWSFKSGAAVGGAPAIADGLVIWGTGYPRSGVAPRIQKNRVFAFELARASRPARDAGEREGDESTRSRGERQLTVMTRNLYLGASLIRTVNAKTLPELVAAVTATFAIAQATNFHERAVALAVEVEAVRPDLIGLQEVVLWRSQFPADLQPTPNATTVEYDFLQILLDAFAARGLRYVPVAVSIGADSEAPRLTPQGLQDVRLTGRDVILARVDRKSADLKLSNVVEGHFATNAVLNTPVGPLVFRRGWAAVDASIRGKTFRFITTHLETPEVPAVQVTQARELLQGPANTNLPVILLGDFNSRADGSGTPTYAILRLAGFDDAWSVSRPGDPGFTCCQSEDLRNPVSALGQRIDLILFRGDLDIDDVAVVGEAPGDRTVSRLWPSDHAGVSATLELPQRQRREARMHADVSEAHDQ